MSHLKYINAILSEVEKAVFENDRFMIATLEWMVLSDGAHILQEPIRWADNYLVACRAGNTVVKELCSLMYDQTVNRIRSEYAAQNHNRRPRHG